MQAFALFGLLIPYPWAAFVLAAGFVALYRRSGRRSTGLAAAAWAVYGLYEYGMKLRVLCTGECNIRVDLLLADPLLAIISVWGLVAGLRRRQTASTGPNQRADTHQAGRIES